jgi:hypothetical protein
MRAMPPFLAPNPVLGRRRMRKGMGIAIRILMASVVTGQGYSDTGGQRYSSFPGSVVRIRPADSTLRHTAARWARKAGVPLDRVAKMVGARRLHLSGH